MKIGLSKVEPELYFRTKSMDFSKNQDQKFGKIGKFHSSFTVKEKDSFFAFSIFW